MEPIDKQANACASGTMQVTATAEALALIEGPKQRYYADALLFHQSGGCCNGSAPMCYRQAECQTGPQDVLVGHIGGVPF